jgi:hypothetical protein
VVILGFYKAWVLNLLFEEEKKKKNFEIGQ